MMSSACSFERNREANTKTSSRGHPHPIYQTNYILHAIHYALALQLNQHHQWLQQQPSRKGKSSPTATCGKGQKETSTRFQRNNHFKLITSGQRHQEKISSSTSEALKQVPRTQAEDSDFTSRAFIEPFRPTSRSIINQKLQNLQLTPKVSHDETYQAEEDSEISLDEQKNAEVPCFGLGTSELREKKEGLLRREVESWSSKMKKVKVPREIKGLLG